MRHRYARMIQSRIIINSYVRNNVWYWPPAYSRHSAGNNDQLLIFERSSSVFMSTAKTPVNCMATNTSEDMGAALLHKDNNSGGEGSSSSLIESGEDVGLGHGGGVGGASGGKGGGGGDGDGGSGDKDDNEEEPDISERTNMLTVMIAGWKSRVAADPDFGYKVLVEQVIGVGAAVVGDMASRPNWGLGELDFVFATLIVGSILNFSLVYLLAPSRSVVGVTKAVSSSTFPNPFSFLLSERPLVARGWPAGNMFEAGQFSVSQRLGNFVFKGTAFAAMGMAAGITGTAISNGLIIVRKTFDPKFETQNKLPNIFSNASAWALHMGISSNIRYQVINGMDAVVVKILPPGVFKVATSAVRTGNNIVGGSSFVFFARLTGVQ